MLGKPLKGYGMSECLWTNQFSATVSMHIDVETKGEGILTLSGAYKSPNKNAPGTM